MSLHKTEVPRVTVFWYGFANNDFEIVLPVIPVAHVAAIDADNNRSFWNRQLSPFGRATLNEARALLPELHFATFGYLVQMVADGSRAGRSSDRWNILQEIDRHAVGNQRSPFGHEEKQFGGGVFGQEPGQWPERPGLHGVTRAAVKARARKRYVAERNSEDDPPLILTLQA